MLHCSQHCDDCYPPLRWSTGLDIVMTVPQNETAAVQPANMLWLIQRDFLQGKTVQQMVHEALLPVPNPNSDRDIEQVGHPLRVF
jgi:hypothetical protein